MGFLFNMFNKGKDNEVKDSTTVNKHNDIDLQKHMINLDKTVVNLEKETNFSLNGDRSKVVLAIDYSYSMSNLYRSGEIQDVLYKLFPIALKLDDNGEMEVYLFQNDYKKLRSLNDGNYSNYVKNVIDTSRYKMGGTNYSDVLQAILDTEVDNSIPTLVLFITDGDNADKSETDKLLRTHCTDNVFIQFIGIGNENFRYLEKLDDLSGRTVDNTGFVKFNILSKADDNKVYGSILKEYIKWRQLR